MVIPRESHRILGPMGQLLASQIPCLLPLKDLCKHLRIPRCKQLSKVPLEDELEKQCPLLDDALLVFLVLNQGDHVMLGIRHGALAGKTYTQPAELFGPGGENQCFGINVLLT